MEVLIFYHDSCSVSRYLEMTRYHVLKAYPTAKIEYRDHEESEIHVAAKTGPGDDDFRVIWKGSLMQVGQAYEEIETGLAPFAKSS